MHHPRAIVLFSSLLAACASSASDPPPPAAAPDPPAQDASDDALVKAVATPGLPARLTIYDPRGDLGKDREPVLANLNAAVADWGQWLRSRGTVWISLNVVAKTSTGRFAGGPGFHVYLERRGDYRVYESAAVHKMRTGASTNDTVPDVNIDIDVDFMRRTYWIDPHPETRTTPVPVGKVDLVTVLAHELGHGLGFLGKLDPRTGAVLDGKSITLYDTLYMSSVASHAPVAVSDDITRVYGGPLPLTFFETENLQAKVTHGGHTFVAILQPSQNLNHYGRFAADSSGEPNASFFGLMAGAWLVKPEDEGRGIRIRVGALDAAVLASLGVPTAPH